MVIRNLSDQQEQQEQEMMDEKQIVHELIHTILDFSPS